MADSFPTSSRYSVEPHGKGYAIYRGRDMYHHGLNLGSLTECQPEVAALIERALNALAGPTLDERAAARAAELGDNWDRMGEEAREAVRQLVQGEASTTTPDRHG